jgi:hypothetical protein
MQPSHITELSADEAVHVSGGGSDDGTGGYDDGTGIYVPPPPPPPPSTDPNIRAGVSQ